MPESSEATVTSSWTADLKRSAAALEEEIGHVTWHLEKNVRPRGWGANFWEGRLADLKKRLDLMKGPP